MTVLAVPKNQRLLMLSYRKDFWDSNTASSQSQWAIVGPSGTLLNRSPDLQALKKKNILVIIHGFEIVEWDILPAYFNIQKQVSSRVLRASQPLYDAVIGITWPGYPIDSENFSADDHARVLAPFLRNDLDQLGGIAAHIDLLANRMGNRFIFEALKIEGKGKLIRNLFSCAPAFDEESIEKRESYTSSLSRCDRVYIFHSNEEDVFRFLYPLVLLEEAQNIMSVDCSAVVAGHLDYLSAPQIYDFISKGLQGEFPTLPGVIDLKILSDGWVQMIHRKKWWDLFTKTATVGANALASLSKFSKR